MASEKERQECERFAHDAMCKDLKTHYEKRGQYGVTGEQIEREVKKIAEEVERKKEHPLYK